MIWATDFWKFCGFIEANAERRTSNVERRIEELFAVALGYANANGENPD